MKTCCIMHLRQCEKDTETLCDSLISAVFQSMFGFLMSIKTIVSLCFSPSPVPAVVYSERPLKLGPVHEGKAVCWLMSLSMMAMSASLFSTSSMGVQDMSYWSLNAPRYG